MIVLVPDWLLDAGLLKVSMASTVKHYLPLRRTLRRSPEKRWPTEPWGEIDCWRSQQQMARERLLGDVMEVGHEEE